MIARAVLAATLAAGARGARPGEFTLRAFLNGKLDLPQAEAIADLISARTESAARVAGAQLEGELSRRVEDHRQALIQVAARLEAAIDFADEEGVAPDVSEIASDLRAESAALRRLAATFRAGRLLREGARVVFAGQPNVGKSSLVNRLLGTNRIIVTPFPGTTRDTIEETADIGGVPAVLIDTAGLREADGLAERFGIERSRSEITRADLVVWVVDGSAVGDPRQGLLDATRQEGFVIALNKRDLPAAISMEAMRACFPGHVVVETAAVEDAGVEGLRQVIASALQQRPDDGPIVTRERHRAALERAASSLDLALEAIVKKHPPEIIAVDVIGALDELGDVIGLTTPEAILDHVFSEFCIGK